MATIAPISTGGAQSGLSGKKNPYRFAFGLITVLFFIFGFITCLNDVLVPHLKALFVLSYTQASLIQFCFFSAYFVVSLPSGKIVTKFGYKHGTVLGLLVTAIGCLLFFPAAGLQSYTIFLLGLFVLASGITLIQVAVNPYVAILGPRETSSARLTLAQAFNSLGTTIAPLFGSFLILSDVAPNAKSVQGPYVALALALVILGVIVWVSHLPHITPAVEKSGTQTEDRASAWKYRHLVLGAIGIFCYVGAEVAIGSYLVNFIGLSEIEGLKPADAAKYVSFYWGAAMVGRFIGAAVLNKIRPGKVLTFNAVIAGLLVLTAMTFGGGIAMYALLAVGLFNSYACDWWLRKKYGARIRHSLHGDCRRSRDSTFTRHACG
jgi:FHS family L-fucose permease-like MFS transporter